jgi:hypothetical protein
MFVFAFARSIGRDVHQDTIGIATLLTFGFRSREADSSETYITETQEGVALVACSRRWPEAPRWCRGVARAIRDSQRHRSKGSAVARR